MSKKYDNVVVIGRFQLPHEAHKALILHAAALANNITIVIGSANQPRTPRNPFTVEERVNFLESLLGDIDRDINYVWVEDSYDDDKWVSDVYSACGLRNNKTTVLVGHKKDYTSFYLDMFPFWAYEEYNPKHHGLSSTILRNKWYKGELTLSTFEDAKSYFKMVKPIWDWGNKHSFEFHNLRNQYKANKQFRANCKDYPRLEQTADAVCVQNGHVLLINRFDNGLWALPGGFVDPDETVLEAAFRELKEETQIDIPDKGLISALVDPQGKRFDQVHRDERTRIITTAFLFRLPHIRHITRVKAGDDAADARWFTFEAIRKMRKIMFSDHVQIIEAMI